MRCKKPGPRIATTLASTTYTKPAQKSAPMVAGVPHVCTLKAIGAMNTNDDARKTGTLRFVTTWNISVPTPAVNNATLGSRPVINGINTNAPNATNSICKPANAVRHVLFSV